jgi:hypothetical protein
MNSIPINAEAILYNWKPVYKINSWWIFAGACVVSILFSWFIQSHVLTDQLYYNYLAERLNEDKIEEAIRLQERAGLLGFLFIPVALFLKIGFTVLCLSIGISLASYQLPFKTLFRIALVAEMAFVFSILVKIFILYMFRDINSLEELRDFSPFSLFSLFNPASVPEYLRYPLQTINLFEVLYCVLLAAGLEVYMNKGFRHSFRLVLFSYGIGLICWVICAVFINLNLSN